MYNTPSTSGMIIPMPTVTLGINTTEEYQY